MMSIVLNHVDVASTLIQRCIDVMCPLGSVPDFGSLGSRFKSHKRWNSGPSCSKLTMSLVNELLKL